MFIEKGLLIKGAASLGIVGAAIGGYVERERIGNLIFGSSSIEESNSLLDRAGIKCDGENGCVLGTDKEITIRQGEVTKEVNALSSADSKGAKITLEKLEGENDYNEGLKFTVKGGNISLGAESPIILENTETYELKEEGGKYILSRKNISIYRERFPQLERAGISCSEESGCVLGEGKEITIRQGEVTKEVNALSSSTGAKITLERLTGGNDYNEGLKFTVVGGNITLGTETPVTLENNETYELKEESGKYILSRKNVSTNKVIPSLLERAGISCSEQSGCVLGNNKTIVIRQESRDKEVNSLSSSTGAKITLEKLNRGQRGYNLGLKFSVDGGDITVGAETSQVTMEKSETYELTEENGKFILSRKNKSIYRGELRIPKGCQSEPTTFSDCAKPAAGNIIFPRRKKEGATPSQAMQDLMQRFDLSLPKNLPLAPGRRLN